MVDLSLPSIEGLRAASGSEFACGLIHNNKAHMDRVRYLSLSFGAPVAVDDHLRVLAALSARNPDRAAAEMRVHLGRIADILAQIRAERPAIFAGASA